MDEIIGLDLLNPLFESNQLKESRHYCYKNIVELASQYRPLLFVKLPYSPSRSTMQADAARSRVR